MAFRCVGAAHGTAGLAAAAPLLHAVLRRLARRPVLSQPAAPRLEPRRLKSYDLRSRAEIAFRRLQDTHACHSDIRHSSRPLGAALLLDRLLAGVWTAGQPTRWEAASLPVAHSADLGRHFDAIA